jgi:hypothetical protein
MNPIKEFVIIPMQVKIKKILSIPFSTLPWKNLCTPNIPKVIASKAAISRSEVLV